ncbi:MAG: MBL fold metallo-hydrolase [Clostridiales bacterium]|nr:MBL fold metallo-hydrolase [Clostridiales bacterium]
MKVTYLHHSGFLVETEQVMLLFDYVGGPIPQLNPDKTLVMLASHRHGDHFDPKIFALGVSHPDVRWILSYDIWKKRIPEAYQSYVPRICRIRPGDRLELAAGEGLVTVSAYKSTDEGVAFIVEADGRTIYHAGDLNDWYWEEETDAWNHSMQADYIRELKKIRADGYHPDVAMVPVDPRLEQWFYLGLAEYMREVGAEMIFPMHFWKDYGIIDRIKNHPSSAAYCGRIAEISREGQEFEC